jgi:DNA-binding beta-propeller fold protein YncE
MLATAVLAVPGFAGVAAAHSDAPGLRSTALQVDADGFVYVVNPDSDSVTKLSPLSSGVQTVQWEAPVGDYPRTLALNQTAVFTADEGGDTVSKIAKADGMLIGRHALDPGCAPYGLTVNQDGNRVYVACQGTAELIVLDQDLTFVARVALDWPMPRAVLVSGDDTRVYVSHFLTIEPNNDAHVSEIDATTNALTGRRYLTVPVDRATCETQNSGQGVTNLVNALNMTPPGSPPEVANQLWVGAVLQVNLTKGLFRRHAGFRGLPEMGLFDLPCPNDPTVSPAWRASRIDPAITLRME